MWSCINVLKLVNRLADVLWSCIIVTGHQACSKQPASCQSLAWPPPWQQQLLLVILLMLWGGGAAARSGWIGKVVKGGVRLRTQLVALQQSSLHCIYSAVLISNTSGDWQWVAAA
jgi:hypothetical protein